MKFKSKFLVLKWDTIQKYLHGARWRTFMDLLHQLDSDMTNAGHSHHKYIVVNRDEPYAQDVIDILKANGHWDEE